MKKKSTKPGDNPYKILYWMGAGVALLLIGVLVLAVQFKPTPGVTADPERTLLWLHDAAQKEGPAALTVIEESRSSGSLTAVAFPAPDAARKAFAEGGARRATENVAALLGRQVHHRVFLPLSVVATMIDAAGGISLEGKSLDGNAAVTLIQESTGQDVVRRATAVMLALSEAISQRGVNMGVSQGLSLARQVETDLDLMSMPDVLARWRNYPTPEIATPAAVDTATLQKLLLPDPAEAKP